jgi:hypothetical protein
MKSFLQYHQIKFCMSSVMRVIQNVPQGKVKVLRGHSIGRSKQEIVYVHMSYSERSPIYSYFTVQYCTVHCTDEQHTVFSRELQSALMLMVEFSKIYYTG